MFTLRELRGKHQFYRLLTDFGEAWAEPGEGLQYEWTLAEIEDWCTRHFCKFRGIWRS